MQIHKFIPLLRTLFTLIFLLTYISGYSQTENFFKIKTGIGYPIPNSVRTLDKYWKGRINLDLNLERVFVKNTYFGTGQIFSSFSSGYRILPEHSSYFINPYVSLSHELCIHKRISFIPSIKGGYCFIIYSSKVYSHKIPPSHGPSIASKFEMLYKYTENSSLGLAFSYNHIYTSFNFPSVTFGIYEYDKHTKYRVIALQFVRSL
jgi:hypothetical protein